MSHDVGRSSIAAALALLVVASSTMAQRPRSRPAQEVPASRPAATQPGAPKVVSIRLPARQGEIMREGSYLLQVRGTMRRDAVDGSWHFLPDRTDEEAPALSIDLPMLPCKMLTNMQGVVEGSPDQSFVFDLSGQVFIYRGRNYLLPTHAPRLTGYHPGVDRMPSIVVEEQDDSAETILEQLDEAAGALPRSPRANSTPREGTGQTETEGATLLWRRGWLSRNGDGTWLFVLESDASAKKDPPMIVMPCLLLERMERYASSEGSAVALLVSGRIYRYEKRSYLLPTSFEVPRHRTLLTP